MARKLIQTNFAYAASFGERPPEQCTGSYLGQRRASLTTIRRFLQANARACKIAMRVHTVTVTSAHVSPWVAK